MLLEHILMGIILIVMPLASIYEIKRIRTDQKPNSKIKAYLKTIGGLWFITVCIILITSPTETFYFQHSIEMNTTIHIVMFFCFLFFIFTNILPLFLLKNLEFKNKIIESFNKQRFILPSTKTEKYLFVWVTLSVGVGEEVIFRSFLVNYFYSPPFNLSITSSMIAAGIIFGLIHFIQGTNGVLNALILGFLLSYLFIATGSLLLPIVLHMLHNLKILLISKVASSPE